MEAGRHLGFSLNACSSGTVSDNCVKFFVQLPIISINNFTHNFFDFQMKSKMAAGRHLGFSFNACSSGTVSDNCVKFFVQLPIISISISIL